LFLLVVFEARIDPSDRLPVRELSGHEGAVCSALHQLRAIVSTQLTEPVVTVDCRVVDDSGVGQ